MGTSYERHKKLRARPWPRWRLAVRNAALHTWSDMPTMYYSEPEAVAAARRLAAWGNARLRVQRKEREGGQWEVVAEVDGK